MLKTIARNTFWNGLGTAGGMVLGVIMSAIIARGLGPADTGLYKYALWLAGVVVTIINLGLPNATARFTAEFLGRDDLASARALLQRVVICELGLGTLAALAVSLGAWWWASPGLRMPLAVAGMVVVPSALANVFQSAAYGAQEYRAANRASVLISAGQLPLALAALWLGWGVPGMVGVVLARQLAYALFLAWHVTDLDPAWSARAVLPTADRGRLLAYMRDMTLILLVSAVVWDSSEIFFLHLYATSEQIAFYALAFEYATRAMSIPSMFSGVLMPSISALYGRGDGISIGRIFVSGSRLIGFIALPIGLGGAAVAPMFAHLLLGSEYEPVGRLLALLLVCNIFGAIAAVNAAVVYGTNDQYFIVKLGLAVTVLNLALDVLLIPRWAAAGAVVANSTSQVTASVVGCAYVARRLDTGFPLGALGRIGLAAAGCAMLAYTVTLVVPGWPGLVAAVACAGAAYIPLLAVTRALEPDDLAILSRLADLLPHPVSQPYRRALGWLGRS
jgi:O-antigen/teichoic acid export membrane protein